MLHPTKAQTRYAFWINILVITTICLAGETSAQVLYGSLTGNVTDQSKAIITGAKVEIKNLGTGATNITVTDSRGSYMVGHLIPGSYRVTIDVPSFKTLSYENVNVEANTTRRLDAELEASTVKETITIAGGNEVLQTDRADINVVQPTRQINDLPLTGSLGRNYQSIMTVVPGSVMAGEQNSAAGNPQRSISFNVNGVSRLQNNTRIDGASVIYPWLPTNTAYVPPAEAIQEVNIVTNSFNAEQGMAGGAAINVSIKTGSNSLHGVGWIYNTNSATQARNYFQTSPRVPKNILNQFGYTVGGPIIKNKLFFFTDFERTTQRNTSRQNILSLAPANLRPNAAGNVDFSSTGVTIYDPASNPDPSKRTPFLNNIIPANRIDTAALELIKRLPLPNAPGFSNNFVANGVAEFNRNNIDAKINYNAGGKLTVFGRYSISPTLILDPAILGEAGGDALNGGQLGQAPGRIQVVGSGLTYTFNSNLVLDTNLGYTRQRLGAEHFDLVSNFGLDVLKIPGTNGTDRLEGGVPAFFVGGWANMGNPNTGNPFLFRDNQYLGAANLAWQKGAHSLRFGVDYQNQQLNHFQPQGGAFQTVRGSFQFNGASTRLSTDPAPTDSRFNSWADFLLGLPSGAGKADQLRNPNSLRMLSYALYARDSWQATKNLTITYGMRWERYPFPDRDNTGVNRFDPTDGFVYTGGLTGVPRDTGASSGPGNFLPRIGIAYRLGENGKTVVRLGYGQSADPRAFIDFRQAYPAVSVWVMPAARFNDAENGFIAVTNLRRGLINTGITPDLSQGKLKLPAFTGTSTYPKDAQRKYIQSWNLTVERELPWKFTGQIGYVGTRAVGQMGFMNINAGAPGTGNAGRPLASLGIMSDINMTMPFKTATYDGLQSSIKRRFGASLFGVSYTLSKAINYNDNDGNPRIQYVNAWERNRGLAGYDRTHNFQSYWVWDIPFGKGRQFLSEGITGKLLGGFQLNGLLSATSGGPFSIIQNTAPNLQAGGSAQIPDQVKDDVLILGGIGAGNLYFDKSAFASVETARFGNVGRNTLRGPGFFMLDLGLFRTISITERFTTQFRVEALNALNHANFGNPGSNISDGATFGIINSTVGQGSRIFRFGARISF